MKIGHRWLMWLLPGILRMMPLHGRRIVIVIMMYRTLIHVGYTTKKDLRVINRHLVLATDPQSLRLPLRLTKYIWSDKLVDGLHFNDWWNGTARLELGDMGLAMGLVRYIPNDLHYDTIDVMLMDMMTLLEINEWSSCGIEESP